jgi:hypothetical protein
MVKSYGAPNAASFGRTMRPRSSIQTAVPTSMTR